MDHLVCFMPGTLALSTTDGLTVAEMKRLKAWTAEKEEDLNLAIELMKTCWGMYEVTKTGLAPEITYFQLPPAEDDIVHLQTYIPNHKASPQEFDPDPDAPWRKDYIIKPADTHNLQRPETVESLFYMWRITGDEKYRNWGWKMFEAFMKYTKAADDGGYTSIGNVNEIPPPSRNNMESFWVVSQSSLP
jgi:endoplasmic reticulum Man9GlcNAc2 1,2-alpha-mannosidase